VATRQLPFRLAGVIWLVLGILMILTVFGTLLGIVMAYFVGIRRNVLAARVGAGLGILLFIPCQMIIDVAGCRHDTCSPEPYLLAYGLPLLVTGLNLLAGWPVRPATAPGAAGSNGAAGPTGPARSSSAPGATVAPGLGRPGLSREASGEQVVWDELAEPDRDPALQASGGAQRS
jgi:hypothetical protein